MLTFSQEEHKYESKIASSIPAAAHEMLDVQSLQVIQQGESIVTYRRPKSPEMCRDRLPACQHAYLIPGRSGILSALRLVFPHGNDHNQRRPPPPEGCCNAIAVSRSDAVRPIEHGAFPPYPGWNEPLHYVAPTSRVISRPRLSRGGAEFQGGALWCSGKTNGKLAGGSVSRRFCGASEASTPGTT